jgi:anthranilate phosphoribosyltransferase
MIREAIAALVAGTNLTETEAAQVMSEIMDGEATPSQLAAFLTALRIKGETVDEIVGMARVMRSKSLHVDVDGALLDTCGTGGDESGTFNVSTASAFVCAAAGVKVAKHGNRAATSASGSADVLEALGARIDLTPQQVATCIERTGFGFMFAQTFHPSMKYAAGTRREIGIRTVFNFLGPLTNPASAQHQLLGVGDPVLAGKMVEALRRLGSTRALVVSSEDGLDEVSLAAPTSVHELRVGAVRTYAIAPADAGLSPAPIKDVMGGSPRENADRIRSIFGGTGGPARDFVLMNSAAALLAADYAESLRDAAAVAALAIDSGGAARVLEEFIALTRSFQD